LIFKRITYLAIGTKAAVASHFISDNNDVNKCLGHIDSVFEPVNLGLIMVVMITPHECEHQLRETIHVSGKWKHVIGVIVDSVALRDIIPPSLYPFSPFCNRREIVWNGSGFNQQPAPSRIGQEVMMEPMKNEEGRAKDDQGDLMYLDDENNLK
jgi:hypothetical protein